MENLSIGTDIEEIKRFENKTLSSDKKFLDKIYTLKELEYCYKTKDYAPHLCARYCAKEAVVKALFGLNINGIYYKDIEILNNERGVPCVKIEQMPDLNVKLSISHCDEYATATAIILKNKN